MSITESSSLLIRRDIYLDSDSVGVPPSRDGDRPQFMDLIYIVPDASTTGFMTYTGDNHRVYRTHTMTLRANTDLVRFQLECPPVDIGSTSAIYGLSSHVVLLSSFLLQGEPWARRQPFEPSVYRALTAFVEQENQRLSRSQESSDVSHSLKDDAG